MDEFASALGTSAHRKTLIRNLIDYRALLAAEGFVAGLQFLDGSFLEDVESTQSRSPKDIDVFSLLEMPVVYRNDIAAWQSRGFPFWRDEIADQGKNKSRFQLDTYAELYPQPGINQIRSILYWYSLFAHQRNTMEWKGFVAVPLDASADLAAKRFL